MFESKTYHEKRAALNEILLQQMLNEMMRHVDPEARQRLLESFSSYAQGQQSIRDAEAKRVLGPVVRDDDVQYADAATIIRYLRANLGRTYFGFTKHTEAPDGAIGTAGFGKKFAEWLQELPDFDQAISKEMESGFYQDTNTRIGQRFPLLVIREGSNLTVIIFNQHFSMQTLNLDYVPADYRWDAHSHYPLRGEMFTYRDDLTIEQFEQQFGQALAAHTDVPLQVPAPVETEAAAEAQGQ